MLDESVLLDAIGLQLPHSISGAANEKQSKRAETVRTITLLKW